MSDTFDFVRRVLTIEEGYLSQPYDCGTGHRLRAQVGYVTIGIGRNLDANPLTDKEILFLFEQDFRRVYSQAETIFSVNGFFKLTLFQRAAIVSLIFHLGYSGFLGFKKMITAIKSGDIEQAIFEMWNSKMGRETRFFNRLKRTEKLLRNEKVDEYETN